MSDRKDKLAGGFLSAPIEVGGKTLRRLTAGTMLVLQQLENRLFTDEGEGEAAVPAGDAATERELLLALCEFVWVHTAPVAEVIEAAESGEEGRKRARHAAWEIMLEMAPEDLTELTEQFQRVKGRVEAAMTAPIEEGRPGKGVPSPTGLPAWSEVSEETGTPGGSNTSCGSSPSKERSNTSTPGNGTTGPGSAGAATADETEDPTSEIPLPSLRPPASDG